MCSWPPTQSSAANAFQVGDLSGAGWAGTERCTRASDDVITSVLQLVRRSTLSLVMEVGVLRIAQKRPPTPPGAVLTLGFSAGTIEI